MKVLLVNKFYYRRGGDCIVVAGMEQLLKNKGHGVAIFSVRHPLNDYSPWAQYFPDGVDFSSPGFAGKLSAAMRLFYSADVARRFNRLLDDFRPDVVHLHNIHSYLSPLVAGIAHKRGIRVFWTLHDYKLVCPTYSCLRNSQVCEECFRSPLRVITGKCMKNSYAASMLAWAEARFWNRRRLMAVTDKFVSPSHFMKTKMVEAGYNADQIEVLHNFMPDDLKDTATATAIPAKGDYYCYTGRLSVEKGIETLLKAASRLPFNLKIIGGGPLLDTLRNNYQHQHIEFCGIMKPEELYSAVQKARFLVLPSIWYENNPLSIIEALCLGTPVLGSRTGGIPELIDERENGFLFTPGDVSGLCEKIHHCFRHFDSRYNFDKIAVEAQNKFGSETFYRKLIKIYDR